MDWLTFISKVIEATAWPAVVVGVLLYLRKELPEIVRSLRKLKFKDVEIEFSQAAKDVEEEAERAIPKPQSVLKVGGKPEDEILQHLNELADISPRAAILEAWLLVETSAAELIRQTTGAASSMPGPLRLKDGLVRAKVLSFQQEQVFEHLRRLRNEAVHALDAEFSQDAVSSYIRAAVTMAAYLEMMS